VKTVRWLRLAGPLGVVCLLVTTLVATPTSADTRKTSSTKHNAGTPGTSSCPIPITRDTNQGFNVGTPAGWNVSTLNGVVLVTKDQTGTEGSVVIPALLVRGLTRKAFFSTASTLVQKEFTLLGGSATLGAASKARNPSALLRGTIGQTPVTGQISTRVIAHRTAKASSLIEVSAHWAPATTVHTDAAALADIGTCYSPQPASLNTIVSDQAFTYPLPPNWSVHDEGQDTLTLDDGSNAGVSYALIQVAPSGVNSSASLLSWFFSQVGIAVTQVLGTYQLPNQTTVTGATQQTEYEEFIGTLNGSEPVHGMIYALSDSNGSITSGVLRMGLTATNLWNADNGEVIHMAGTIQHDFTQDLQELENISAQWQQFDQGVQDFDNALTGITLVKDPSTGQVYEAPYDAYGDGPDGPGYYGPNGQPLTPVNS
jgi:hypothetical protein